MTAETLRSPYWRPGDEHGCATGQKGGEMSKREQRGVLRVTPEAEERIQVVVWLPPWAVEWLDTHGTGSRNDTVVHLIRVCGQPWWRRCLWRKKNLIC